MKRTGSERPPPVLTPAEHPHRHSSRKVIERVPFTSGLVLCLTLVVFGTSFVALEDTSWAIAGGDGGYRMALHRAPVAYRVGLRRVHDSQGSPLLLADLCADEVALTLGSARSSGPRLLASSRSRLGPWCTCARLGRWVQWMLYGTCFFSLAAAGLAIIADTHVRRSKRLRHQPVVAGSGPSVGSWTTISNPMLVSTVLSWVCAWLLLLLSLLTWAVFAPHSVLLGTSGEPLALKVGGIYVWLRHALALATFFGATILAALLGVWTEQDLVHAVVTLMRCSRVVKLTYLMLVLQLLLIALAPVTGVGGEAMLCAAGLYALHEQQARPKLLEWYLALLSCFCVISTVDVISARPCISQVIATLTACNTETFVQEAQLGLKLAVFALLALELWPASWGGRLSEMRRRDTFSGDPDASPGAQASPCSLGSRRGRRDQLGVPPWLFHVGVLLWDGSYLLSSLADIISDVAVMWQWNRVGMHGHFAVGVAVFASTSVWYTMFFVLLLVTSGSSSAPDSTDSAPSSDSNAGGESARKRRPHAPTALQRLANCVKARVGVSRVSMLALFLALLPFGQAFPFLVYGMLRAAPPELIREYAVRVLGGSAARLLADDDFFDWSMSLLPCNSRRSSRWTTRIRWARCSSARSPSPSP
ncbi:hypothetical protein T492DRAFT_230404 [Pavlovales sp. CCMP2436]|nr:hypothetical protein T492DRAFT_230404 [Pavlovales sp. CCMP2436]